MDSTTHIYELELYDDFEYKKLRKNLKINDVLIIKCLSAIGNTPEDIQSELANLTKKIKADLVVLDMPLFDTRINKDVNGTLVIDLVIQTLASAKKINNNIRKVRQSQGIAQAQALGVKFGRPAECFPDGFNNVYARYIAGEITKTQGANELGITFHKMSRFLDRKTRDLNNKSH